MQNIYESVAANKRRSNVVVLLFSIFVLLVVYLLTNAIAVYLGEAVSPLGFFGLALIITGFTTFYTYYFSDRIIASISQAIPVDKKTFPLYFGVVENLCLATRQPLPRLYVINDTAMNAFAAGRDPQHSLVCVTTGLLNTLNRTELEGVIGHELSHINNYDTRLMSLVTVMAGVITLLSDWFLRIGYSGKSRDRRSSSGLVMLLGIFLALLAPFIGQLIKLAISRRREYLADVTSVKITHQPNGLISALTKISSDSEKLEAANKATAHLYFANPFHEDSLLKFKTGDDVRGKFTGLFNTHPPIADRIKILQSMT